MGVFKQKKNKPKVKIDYREETFAKAFQKRLGQEPVTYIANKIAKGSDIKSIRYLFDIVSAEIEKGNNCRSPGFDYYYARAKSVSFGTNSVTPPTVSLETRAGRQVKDWQVSPNMSSKQEAPLYYNDEDFLKAFEIRMSQSPIAYIKALIGTKQDKATIEFLFNKIAEDLYCQYKCKSPGFDYYYRKACKTETTRRARPTDTRVAYPDATGLYRDKSKDPFPIKQMIGGEQFLNVYFHQLKKLHENPQFMGFIQDLRKEVNGRETSDTKVANKIVADYFYNQKANERFPEVRAIVERVKEYGKQASAHISIYYAMFLYEE